MAQKAKASAKAKTQKAARKKTKVGTAKAVEAMSPKTKMPKAAGKRKKAPAKKVQKAATAPANKGKARPQTTKVTSNPFDIVKPKEMETVMAQTKTQFEKFNSEFGKIGQDGFEAFFKSISIFAKGSEDIIRTSVSLAQSSAEKQSKYMKDALSSKTLNEWTDVQNKIAQASFDDFMAGATKISELSVKTLSESVEPFNEQISKGIKKASETIAA